MGCAQDDGRPDVKAASWGMHIEFATVVCRPPSQLLHHPTSLKTFTRTSQGSHLSPTPPHKPHTLHTLRIRDRLAAVDVAAGLDGFPVADLVAASSFDEAQARALGAALLRELAVVQGPPGTGGCGHCNVC